VVVWYVEVTMQAQREAPPDMQCKDKFLVQSVIAPVGSSPKELVGIPSMSLGGVVFISFVLSDLEGSHNMVVS